jgi:hypothetical protein
MVMNASVAYVGAVMSRHFRTLVTVLVAAQILLSAPVVAAVTFDAETPGTASMPCADMMPAAADGEPCPCCPDGVENAAGCLSACLSTLGATPMTTPAFASGESAKAMTTLAVPLARAAEPPIEPPPIR